MTDLDSDVRPDWLTRTAWPWTIRRLATDRGPIAYTDTGSGPVLLFVHAGMWSFIWRDLIVELSRDHRCISLDAPGNGLSPREDATQIGVEPAAVAVGALIDHLDLRDITIVMHDLGGPASIGAAAARPQRIARIVAVNTFAWRPMTRLLRFGLAVMGSAAMRWSDAATGWFPAVTATRLGVARHWDAESRAVFRRGMPRAGRNATHAYFASARRSPRLFDEIEAALAGSLRDRPVMTVFGRNNDYFGFQPEWKRRFPTVRQHVLDGGNHFPMCDDPHAVAGWVREWMTEA